MGGENWCAETFFDHQQEIANLAGLESVPQGLWPSWSDPRIDAMVGFAPDGYAFGPNGLKSVTIPVMLVGGSDDHFNPAEYNVYQTYEFVGSSEKSQVVFDGANHLIFNNDCAAIPWAIDMGAYWFCSDSVWDMNRAHDLINHFTTAFVLSMLKNDTEARAALAPDAVSFPGITYQAAGF
jgi:predicted dienelactone hydrolase